MFDKDTRGLPYWITCGPLGPIASGYWTARRAGAQPVDAAAAAAVAGRGRREDRGLGVGTALANIAVIFAASDPFANPGALPPTAFTRLLAGEIGRY